MSDDAPGDAGSSPADRIATAVEAVPGVHALHGGVGGEIATYLPGRRVSGVRVRDTGCAVHVVLTWDAPIGATTDLVRAAARPHATGPIDVTVEDVAPPTPRAVPAP